MVKRSPSSSQIEKTLNKINKKDRCSNYLRKAKSLSQSINRNKKVRK